MPTAPTQHPMEHKAQLKTQTGALLHRMSTVVGEHINVITIRQAESLGRLQMAILQTGVRGQSGHRPIDACRAELSRHAERFEQQYARHLAPQLPTSAPWCSLPAASSTLGHLRLAAHLMQTQQTLSLAEARVCAASGPEAAQKLCTKLLGPRLALAFVYDAARLACEAAGRHDAQNMVVQARLVTAQEVMLRVDMDLADIFAKHAACAFTAPSQPDAKAPAGDALDCDAGFDLRLQGLCSSFQTRLMTLRLRLEDAPDPTGLWRTTCDAFARLLFGCKQAYASKRCDTSALEHIVDDAITQLHRLTDWLEVPDAVWPEAARAG